MPEGCREPLPTDDGRRLRRDRNRDAVARAFLELVADGDLKPSLAAVADRSGVSYRSVFRYFADQSELALTAFRRLFDHVDEIAPLHVRGDDEFEERIVGLVDQRLRLHARIHGVVRLFRSFAVDDPAIAAELRAQRRAARGVVDALFAHELDALPADRRADVLAMVDVSTSFDHLDLLLVDHELPPERVRRLVSDAVRDHFTSQLARAGTA